MAAATPTPTTAKLMAIITQLQAQIPALQNAAPAAAAAPPARAAPVVFADTPQTLGTNDLIDYLTNKCQPFSSKGAKLSTTRHLPMALPWPPTKLSSSLRRSTILPWQWAGTKVPGRSPHSITAPDVKSTSSRATAKSRRPLSNQRVRGCASLGKPIPRLAQSRTTQWWAFV